jgi:DNA-directed RNA polymerase alpha subunit
MIPKVKNYYFKNVNIANSSSPFGGQGAKSSFIEKNVTELNLPTFNLQFSKVEKCRKTKKCWEVFNDASNNSFCDSTTEIDRINKKKEKFYGNLSIGILHLSLRSYTYLKRLKINTIQDLINFLTKQKNSTKTIELSNIKLNPYFLQEIKNSLRKLYI